ncbi:MAG: hypothetical protein KF760_30765 [Candidatus Eremiobacteraeota bacterium]|nr:hypothetical protein [Candidatus Eremiobacteraeota bacterium]MCW5868630.1 hypothetical protein [Candidatus Eremiobacteraeota bacterium]
MKKRGISLLETIVSVQILLIVSLFCMSIFGQGQRHDLRARQFSTCSLLANQKMQELTSQPVRQLRKQLVNAISGNFSGDFADYSYNVTLSDYEPGLSHLEVVARSHLGCLSRCSLLIPSEVSGRGIASDPDTSRIYYVGVDSATGEGKSRLTSFSDPGSPPTDGPPTADGLALSGVAGSPGQNWVWGISPEGTMTGFNEQTNQWVAAEEAPGSPPLATLFHSLACDASAHRVVASDVANRCLWLYDYDWVSGPPYWYARPCRPSVIPLGTPGAVATDPYATLVWVADTENNCLRKFLFSDDVAPGNPNLEPVWSSNGRPVGYWDRRAFRPNEDFLGTPCGIAMDEQGSQVFVADRGRVWRFEEATDKWTPICTFASLGGDLRPAGMTCDRFGTVLYISCYDGRIIKVSGASWTPAFVPGT